MIKALPKDRKSLDELAKLCLNTPLKKGEIFVMADTGSTLTAMNVSKKLPEYAHLLREMSEAQRGCGAECGNGGTLEVKGTVDLTGFINGKLHTTVSNDMDTTMPTASMIQTIKKGNKLLITDRVGMESTRRRGMW